jgi:ribosomal protein L37AE/L43A/VanZ family protein
VTARAGHWTQRVARPWRVAFVLYAIVLTIFSHWPALTLGDESQPAPDQLLHMVLFGGLVFLLWGTRWLRRPAAAVAIVVVWAVVDEITQSLPILRRTFSFQDIAAGQLGAVLVGAWWWALAPVGGPPNRMRVAYQSFIVADLCGRWRTLLLAVLAGIAGATVFGVAAWLILSALPPVHGNPGNVILAVIVGAVAAAHVTLAARFGARARVLSDQRPCFACGAPCRDVPFDDAGRGTCGTCGAALHRGQWAPPMELPMSAALRGAGRALLVSVGIVVLAVALFSVVLVLSMRAAWAKSLLGAWQHLDMDMRLVIDLTLVGLALAIGMRMYRVRQARLHDRQHVECRACGHDLTGTPVDRGIGRCPECGGAFARIVQTPESGTG